MLGRFRAYVSSSPLAHVVIAAFIGAALPPVYVALEAGNFSTPAVKMALYAAISAGLRAVILLVPSSKTAA